MALHHSFDGSGDSVARARIHDPAELNQELVKLQKEAERLKTALEQNQKTVYNQELTLSKYVNLIKDLSQELYNQKEQYIHLQRANTHEKLECAKLTSELEIYGTIEEHLLNKDKSNTAELQRSQQKIQNLEQELQTYRAEPPNEKSDLLQTQQEVRSNTEDEEDEM